MGRATILNKKEFRKAIGICDERILGGGKQQMVGEYNGEDNFPSQPSGGAIIPSELSSCPVGSGSELEESVRTRNRCGEKRGKVGSIPLVGDIKQIV